MKISRFFPNKCIRNQIWPCHKVGHGQPRFIICADPHPQCYIPSPKAIVLLVTEKKIFKGFLPYMGVVAILVSCDKYDWYKFWLTYHKESSYEIWVQLAKCFLRKLRFNVLMGLIYDHILGNPGVTHSVILHSSPLGQLAYISSLSRDINEAFWLVIPVFPWENLFYFNRAPKS